MDNTYFTDETGQGLAKACWRRLDDFYAGLHHSLAYRRAAEGTRQWYGLPDQYSPWASNHLATLGDENQLLGIRINEFGSLGRGLLSLICGQKVKWQAVSVNDDAASDSDTIAGQQLLDSYLASNGIESSIRSTVECSIMQGGANLLIGWEPFAGPQMTINEQPVFDPNTGNAVFEGSLKVASYSMFDTVIPIYHRGTSPYPWKILRDWVSTEVLCRQFPRKAELIRKAAQAKDGTHLFDVYGGDIHRFEQSIYGDQVALFTLYHVRDGACPKGKLVKFVSAEDTLFEGDLPYATEDQLPIYELCPSKMVGTNRGFTPMTDLLALSKAVDMLFSTALSNANTHGLGQLLLDKRAGVAPGDIGGAKAIYYNGALGNAPSALESPQTHGEVFNLATLLTETMQRLVALSPVQRGNPDPKLSGVAMGLMNSASLSYQSNLNAGYVKLVEDAGSGLIRVLQQFGSAKRNALILGKADAWMMKDFTDVDLNKIARVKVQVGNPITSTPGGQVGLADAMKDKLSPDEYVAMVETGRLRKMTRGPESELQLISRENEDLMVGKQCPVLRLDTHPVHVQEHKALLDNPEIRRNGKMVDLILQHISQHENFMKPPPAPPQPPSHQVPLSQIPVTVPGPAPAPVPQPAPGPAAPKA